MDLKNLFAAIDVRQTHGHLTVKSSGAQQGWIENVRPVRGRDDDDAILRIKSVHFDEELVKRLFSFVMASSESMAAVPPDSVDLINEDETGCILLSLLEHVADA